MIVSERKSWLALLFSVKGSSFTHTWPRIAAATLVAIVALELHNSNIVELTMSSKPFAPLGLALGIFLGFRNNESYNRYWNGRKIWGRLVNVSRTFVRQVSTFTRASDSDYLEIRNRLAYRMIAYVYSLRHHLRDTLPFDDLKPYIDDAERAGLRDQKNVPMTIIQRTAMDLRAFWQTDQISDYHLKAIDDSLTEIIAIQGGCERIRSTPIPYVYTVLIHRLTTFYCLFLPFGIVAEAGSWTPIVTFLISYAFFGLDDLGEELKDPFGIELNDLPLEAINRTIEVNIKQLIGDKAVPDMLKPVGDQLF
jgi:ion channel-forming bestrophin family protein